MRVWIISLFLMVLLVISGCDFSGITGAAVVCNKPYIRVGTSCCLDQNDNKICDSDETAPVEETPEEQLEPKVAVSSCPYECCVLGNYEAKLCGEDYLKCVNNKCVQKDCPYECCDGFDYAKKSCSQYYSCVNNKCVPQESDKGETPSIQPTASQPSTPITPQGVTEEITAIVSRVIDGDTVELNTGESVRLLGINTGERGQPCYQEAKDRLKQLVLNKKVTLEEDVEDKDRRDRLLRYLYVDDTFVNLVLVREGLATAWIIRPNVKHEAQMKQAEEEAKQDATGCLWKKVGEDYSDCFVITNFNYDAYGNDHYNLNDEYVTLKNTCNFPIDMTSWTVSDLANHVYMFSTFNFYSQASVTLYSGSGTNTAEELYWGRNQAVWNNDGDTFYLRDANSNLVFENSYS